MRPQFELSKNIIILVLISIICALVTHDVIRNMKVSKNEDKSLYEENAIQESQIISLQGAVMYLSDENEKLVRINDSLTGMDSEILFYDNAPDTTATIEFVRVSHMVKHNPQKNGDMWVEGRDGVTDTMLYCDGKISFREIRELKSIPNDTIVYPYWRSIPKFNQYPDSLIQPHPFPGDSIWMNTNDSIIKWMRENNFNNTFL